MIVVTGGAGFIGSNVIQGLNRAGRSDIVVVDDLTDARKATNLAGLGISDYLDRDEFLDLIDGRSHDLDDVTAIIHQGASSSTTEPDGRYVMRNNYTYSKRLLHYAAERELPCIYASSGSVYGVSTSFEEIPANETPLNVYGLSKLLTDHAARQMIEKTSSQIVGIRYFNVYGPGEDHKDSMSSIVAQLDCEVIDRGTASLFGESMGFGPGEHRRDFVHVDDVVDVVLWFLAHPDRSGVFNCGTGESRTYLDVADAVLRWHGSGEVRFVDVPAGLQDRYQPSTCADLTRLRAAGYDGEFTPLERGIDDYLGWRARRRA